MRQMSVQARYHDRLFYCPILADSSFGLPVHSCGACPRIAELVRGRLRERFTAERVRELCGGRRYAYPTTTTSLL